MATIAPQPFVLNPVGPAPVQQQTSAAEGSDDVDAKKAYKDHLKLLKEGAKALFRAGRKLAAADAANKKLPNFDGNAFTKTELAAYQKQYGTEMSKLGKLVTAAMKGKTRAGSGGGHLSAPFYVSRQLIDFVTNVNFGYGGADANQRVADIFLQYQATGTSAAEAAATQLMRAEQPSGQTRVQDMINTYMPEFFTDGVTSAQMITSLLRLYFISHGLRSKNNGTYFNLNEEFIKWFGPGTNTHLIMRDGQNLVDLTERYGPSYVGQDLSKLTEDQRKLADKFNMSISNLSVIDRLNIVDPSKEKKTESLTSSGSKKENRSWIPQAGAINDIWGVAAISGTSRIVNFFRISKEVLPADKRDYLTAGPSAEDPDPDRRPYAQRKTDAIVAYIAGHQTAEEKKVKGAKATKQQKGLIDAQNLATHISDEANAKALRSEKNRLKSERARQEAAFASGSTQFHPAQIDPSLIPKNMFTSMPTQGSFPHNPLMQQQAPHQQQAQGQFPPQMQQQAPHQQQAQGQFPPQMQQTQPFPPQMQQQAPHQQQTQPFPPQQ